MAKRTGVPRKRGRPATGKEPLLNARMPPEMIQRIDRWAAANDVSRSEALRRLISMAMGLPVPPRQRKRKASRKK